MITPINSAQFNRMITCSDWQHSASVLGMIRFFDNFDIQYEVKRVDGISSLFYKFETIDRNDEVVNKQYNDFIKKYYHDFFRFVHKFRDKFADVDSSQQEIANKIARDEKENCPLPFPDKGMWNYGYDVKNLLNKLFENLFNEYQKELKENKDLSNDERKTLLNDKKKEFCEENNIPSECIEPKFFKKKKVTKELIEKIPLEDLKKILDKYENEIMEQDFFDVALKVGAYSQGRTKYDYENLANVSIYESYCSQSNANKKFCRINGFAPEDVARKKETYSWGLDSSALFKQDCQEFDYILFAFTMMANDRDYSKRKNGFFVNNNFDINELVKTNNLIQNYCEGEVKIDDTRLLNQIFNEDYASCLENNVEIIMHEKNLFHVLMFDDYVLKKINKISLSEKQVAILNQLWTYKTEKYSISDEKYSLTDLVLKRMINHSNLDDIIIKCLAKSIKIFYINDSTRFKVIGNLIKINEKLKSEDSD